MIKSRGLALTLLCNGVTEGNVDGRKRSEMFAFCRDVRYRVWAASSLRLFNDFFVMKSIDECADAVRRRQRIAEQALQSSIATKDSHVVIAVPAGRHQHDD